MANQRQIGVSTFTRPGPNRFSEIGAGPESVPRSVRSLVLLVEQKVCWLKGHLANPLGWLLMQVGGVQYTSTARSTMWVQRSSACPVRMLSIRMMGEWRIRI